MNAYGGHMAHKVVTDLIILGSRPLGTFRCFWLSSTMITIKNELTTA